jgi:hypothetical protein
MLREIYSFLSSNRRDYFQLSMELRQKRFWHVLLILVHPELGPRFLEGNQHRLSPPARRMFSFGKSD